MGALACFFDQLKLKTQTHEEVGVGLQTHTPFQKMVVINTICCLPNVNERRKEEDKEKEEK